MGKRCAPHNSEQMITQSEQVRVNPTVEQLFHTPDDSTLRIIQPVQNTHPLVSKWDFLQNRPHIELSSITPLKVKTPGPDGRVFPDFSTRTNSSACQGRNPSHSVSEESIALLLRSDKDTHASQVNRLFSTKILARQSLNMCVCVSEGARRQTHRHTHTTKGSHSPQSHLFYPRRARMIQHMLICHHIKRTKGKSYDHLHNALESIQ